MILHENTRNILYQQKKVCCDYIFACMFKVLSEIIQSFNAYLYDDITPTIANKNSLSIYECGALAII
jgi:hypothetical protein